MTDINVSLCTQDTRSNFSGYKFRTSNLGARSEKPSWLHHCWTDNRENILNKTEKCFYYEKAAWEFRNTKDINLCTESKQWSYSKHIQYR